MRGVAVFRGTRAPVQTMFDYNFSRMRNPMPDGDKLQA
jgi:hypothetical protein